MISHELERVYITSDGSKFLSKDEALRHEELMKRGPKKKIEHRLRHGNTGQSKGTKAS